MTVVFWAYYRTYLPGYNVHIVTASADSPDAERYCDFAIGWFPAADDELQGIEGCVKSRWFERRCYGQDRWAYLLSTGRVDDATALAWAADVWDRHREESADVDP